MIECKLPGAFAGKMILASKILLPFRQRMMSKMRPVTVVDLASSLYRLDGSDNQSLIEKAVDHSWVTGMVHHTRRRVNGSSDSKLTVINDRTVIIVQVGVTCAHLVNGVPITDELCDVAEQKATNKLEKTFIGFVDIMELQILQNGRVITKEFGPLLQVQAQQDGGRCTEISLRHRGCRCE